MAVYRLDQHISPVTTEPAVFWNCTICGHQTPQGQPHECTGLSKRQKARIEAHKRQQAAEKARAEAPQRCVDCGTVSPPRAAHLCSGRVDGAAEMAARAQMAGFVNALQQAGLQVSPQ